MSAVTVVFAGESGLELVRGALISADETNLEIKVAQSCAMAAVPGAAAGAVIFHDDPVTMCLIVPKPGEQGPVLRLTRIHRRDN
jgi:hypothetical protein